MEEKKTVNDIEVSYRVLYYVDERRLSSPLSVVLAKVKNCAPQPSYSAIHYIPCSESGGVVEVVGRGENEESAIADLEKMILAMHRDLNSKPALTREETVERQYLDSALKEPESPKMYWMDMWPPSSAF
jgi:hypothetical protein